MYNIYFDKRLLTVCAEKENAQYDSNAVIYHSGENSQLSQLPFFFDKSQKINLLYVPVPEENIDNTFKQICSEFSQLNAGGGIVLNKRGEYLLIFRNGLWDLPKGKQEPNEDIRNSAMREVEEECGINDLNIKELICVTHHCYHLNGNFMLKHTYWYKMLHTNGCIPKPQLEENIQKCLWVKKEDLPQYLSNTYPSILEVFKSFSEQNI
ncbi:MAG: NUDIX domain-containing protein [Bacteroidales bacterium]